TSNPLAVLDLAGRSDVPVAPGAPRALVRNWVRQEASFHGETGLGRAALPPASRGPRAAHAVDFIAERAAEAPLTLVAVGPLTNVALLLARHPPVAERIERLVVMGGARTAGNVTPAAEFNVFVDPEAAYRAFTSGLDLTMIDLDLTHQALLEPHEVEAIRALGEGGRIVARLLDFYAASYATSHGGPIVPLHDAVAVADLVDPGLIEKVPARVEVEYASGPERGRTAVELETAPANVSYGLRIDRDTFAELLVERLTAVLGEG